MSLFSIFNIAGSGMSAQSVRMNTVASNLANAGSTATDPANVYRAKQPVFQSIMTSLAGKNSSTGVMVSSILESTEQPKKVHDPKNPLANEQGYVYKTNVNSVEEMTNMISASRSFQNNVEVLNTTKQLLLATIKMGQ